MKIEKYAVITLLFLVFLVVIPGSAGATALLSAGTGSWNYTNGTNGQAYHEYLQTGNNFTSAGNITQLKFVVAPNTNLSNCTAFYVRVWRLNETGNYTCVGSTPDLKSELTLNLNTINLSTPIPVQVGDVYGYAMSSTGGYIIRIVGATGCNIRYITDNSTASVGTSLNWSDAGNVTDYGEKLYKIDFYDTYVPSVSSISPNTNGYIVPVSEPVKISLGQTYQTISVLVDDDSYSSLTNTDHADITFAEGSHIVTLATENGSASTQVHAFDDIAQASPYLGNHSTVSPTLGKSGTYLQAGNQQRIRQTGEIRYVGAYLQNTATLTHFSLQIWRRNAVSGNYTLVTNSGNLTVTGDGYNLIPITGISVHEGDYYGFSVVNSKFTLAVDASATGTTLETTTYKSPMWTSMDFDNVTIRADTTYRIDIFEDCPDLVTIGDSHISGFPTHRSMADPQGSPTLFYPASSIAYQLSQLNGWTYQNMGYSGQRSDEIRARFEKDVIEKHPTYAIIEGGFNDYKIDRDEELTKADLAWMYNRAIEEGITPIGFEILPTNSKTKGGDESNMTERDNINTYIKTNYRGVFPVACGRNYVGQYNSSGPNGNLWDVQAAYVSADGYHYTTTGYARLALAIYYELLAFNTVYTGTSIGNYTINASGKIKYERGINTTDTPLGFSAIPSAGNLTVQILNWQTSGKCVKSWVESSTTSSATSQHVMSGFPANKDIVIMRDGTIYTTTRSNNAGVISWTYSGGYSDHIFLAMVYSPVVLTVYSTNDSALTTASETSENISISTTHGYAGAMGGLANAVQNTITNGVSLGVLIILIFAAFGILRYIGYI